MNKFPFSFILVMICAYLMTQAVPAFSEDTNPPDRMRITALYGGVTTNTYKDSAKNISLKDSGFMSGAYLQWIETGLFQANFFGYYAPSVNYSKVYGLHGNIDGYFLSSGIGSFVAGIDIEDININMDAKDNITGLKSFTMKNNVLFGMVRSGYRFAIQPSSALRISFFPYAGATRETVDGDIRMITPRPNAPETVVDISEKENFFSWGTNLTVNMFHFIDITAKYLGRAKKDDYLNSVTAQATVYVSRYLSVTYQFKYMQLSNGTDTYNLLGVGFIF